MSSLLAAFDGIFSKTPGTNSILSITDFAKNWCGINLTLAQKVLLKIYAGDPLDTQVRSPHVLSEQEWFDQMYLRGRFPENVYERILERGDGGFSTILLVVGRGGTKTTLIALATLYTVYKVLMHNNPQEYYGIQDFETIEIAIAATSEQQSKDSPFSHIQNFCKKAIANRTPLADWIDKDGIETKSIYFKTRKDAEIEEEFGKKRSRSTRNASVRIRVYNSNIDSFRGGAVIAAILDEFAQFKITNDGRDSAEYFHSTLTARLPQFKGDGRLFVLSTPQGRAGKFYEIYQDVWEGRSRATIGMKMPTWEAWEAEPTPLFTLKKLSEDDRIAFEWHEDESKEEALERAPASFKREFGAEFEGAEDQWLPTFYLTSRDEDRGIFRPHLKHMRQGMMGRVYAAHADPARTTDAFALSIVHKEMHEEREIIVVDQTVRWFVAPNPSYKERDYEFIIRQHGPEPAFIHTSGPMEYMKKNILSRFNVGVFTFDQYNSAAFVDDLAYYAQSKSMRTIIKIVPATRNFNKEKADLFEQLVLEERLWCYPHEVLQEELLGLRKDHIGRIEAGPGTHDDMYSALSNAALQCLEMPAIIDQNVNRFRGRAFNIDPVMPNVRL